MQEGMINILDLIPQRSPIVMVDNFCGIDNLGKSYTELTLREDNIFIEDGKLSECGLIEHIAQSAAARVGYLAQTNNEPVPIGFIGSVNNFQLYVNPLLGEKINTSVEIIQDVMNISLIESVCMVSDKIVATCRMKIFLDK